MSFLGLPQASDKPPPEPITGTAYLSKLHKYLQANAVRLAPTPPSSSSGGRGRNVTPSLLQQSYTLLTLGLDPNSAPLSRNVKIPLTLGFGTPVQPKPVVVKPLLLRLPPDRLLYLMLRWQSLPQSLPHVGRTDVPIEPGVPVAARGARVDERRGLEGDVRSVSSWVGSMRSVSLGSMVSKEGGRGWFGKNEGFNEDQILLALYSMFTLLPALLIHPPFFSEPPILDLIEAGGYTQLGGIDVRVPLDVLRNLQILELEAYDPRALLAPPNPGLRSLTVRDVQDGDDWIDELLSIPNEKERSSTDDTDTSIQHPIRPRFPNLRHLSLIRTTLLSFPSIPLTSLTHLDLSHNLLDSLPAALSLLSSLISLNLSNNVITSVRSAPSVLGNITSLNLSRNRIDCLVGLERVLGLERVDLRGNELLEEDEVGRLSVLPHIKEIWCVSNPFDRPRPESVTEKEEWRIEVGIMFKSEGKEVILDDTAFSWSEARRIDALLLQRGKTSRSERVQSIEHSHNHGHSEHPPSTNGHGSTLRNQQYASVASRQPTRAAAVSPASSAAVSKKKGRRRVIRLDSDVPAADDSEASGEVGSGSIRRPARVKEEDELESRLDVALSLRGDRLDTFSSPRGDIAENGRSGTGIDLTAKNDDADRNGDAGDVAVSNVKSVKVSTKRRTARKGLAKDTFVPMNEA